MPDTRATIIVEDDTVTRSLLLRVHAALGLTPHGFVDAEGALAWVAAAPRRPVLCSVDLELPGTMQGEVLCARLRAMPETSTTALLILSSRAVEVAAVAATADLVLRKPIDLGTYAAAVRRLAAR